MFRNLDLLPSSSEGNLGASEGTTHTQQAFPSPNLMMETHPGSETWCCLVFTSQDDGNALNRSDSDSYFLKNGIFWDVALCGSRKNRRFGGT
jgi:hypothetical protein